MAVNQISDGITEFGEIVRRDIGCHAHGDTGGSVQEQIGQTSRKQERFLQAVIKIRAKIDRFFVDVFKQFGRYPCQPCFGIAHGRRAVSVNAAEIPLTINQHIAHGEILRHAHHGIIDGCIAVWMVFTQHFTHNTGAFAMRSVVSHARIMHRIKDTAVHRFESITGVRKGAGHDDAHGVIEVRIAHFVVDVDRIDCRADFQENLPRFCFPIQRF